MEKISISLDGPEKILPFKTGMRLNAEIGGKTLQLHGKVGDLFIIEGSLLNQLAMLLDVDVKLLRKKMIENLNYAKKLSK